MRKICKVLSVLMTVWALFFLGGCQKEGHELFDNKSTTCGNIVMGDGTFAYDHGFLYYADGNDIYEYDMETGKTIVIDAKSIGMYSSLYSQGQYIYFANGGLSRITKDGKKNEKVFKRDGGCLMLYVEGTDAYYLDGVEGNMYHRDLESDKETEILSAVFHYYIDEEHIYAISKKDGVLQLYISEREEINFKVEELSFTPIRILAVNGCLYMAEQGKTENLEEEQRRWQIIKYSSEGEERLPIYGLYYQVIGDRIIYQEDQERGFDKLLIYNISTGESETICENVTEFNVFENKLVCVRYVVDGKSQWLFYNLETKEMTEM